MTRGALIGLTAVVVILGVAIVLEPVLGMGQDPYFASLAATFAGVLAAVPLALALDRHRQAAEERLRASATAEENAQALSKEHRRVTDVLELVKSELAEDLVMLDVRTSTPWSVGPPFIRSDVWHALNASGETVGIQANLIGLIARAYHQIEATALVERETFRLSLDPLVRTIQWASVEAAGSGPSPLTAARNVLTSTDGATRGQIQQAISEIDVAIETGALSPSGPEMD